MSLPKMCWIKTASSFNKIINIQDKENAVDLIYLNFSTALYVEPCGTVLDKLEKMGPCRRVVRERPG